MRTSDGRRSGRCGEGGLRRAWSLMLAVLLVLTGAGLGPAAPRAGAVTSPSQAGAGSADGRDPALLRAAQRPAILSQRAADPHAPAMPPAPALPALGPSVEAAARGIVRTADGRTGPPLPLRARPYEARAPPAAA